MAQEKYPLGLGDRVVSLDFFRGLTIAAMIFFGNLINEMFVFKPLLHAQWHGCTVRDLFFPFFLFIVGVSMAFSFSKRLRQPSTLNPFGKIFRRTLILFTLGLFLNFFPQAVMNKHLFDTFDIVNLRIPGTLQRISVCYLFASVIVLKFKEKGQYIIAAALLSIYWVSLYAIPVPGYGAGNLSLEGNVCGYIDRIIIGPTHVSIKDKVTHSGIFDPEGILSTLPAIATTLFGYFAGRELKNSALGIKKVMRLFVIGGVMAFAGLIMDRFFPINKQLWTSSYAVFTAGLAMICLALCYYAIDLRNMRFGIMPMVFLGTNAIAMFVGNGLLERIFIHVIKIPSASGEVVSLKAYILKYHLIPWTSPMIGALLFATFNVLLWIFIAGMLYKKRIFIKI